MSYINSKGELKSLKFFSINEFDDYINRYKNCFTLGMEKLDDYEVENIKKDYGDFINALLICVDYPNLGAFNYFLIEREDKFQICLCKDALDIDTPYEFIDKLACLTEYKI